MRATQHEPLIIVVDNMHQISTIEFEFEMVPSHERRCRAQIVSTPPTHRSTTALFNIIYVVIEHTQLTTSKNKFEYIFEPRE